MSVPALVLALALQAEISSPREDFARAEALYQERRYEEAARVYESIRAQGIEDGALYYNLGNAYFESGELGLAILNYERARELLPSDDDVRANLSFASGLVADEVPSPPFPPPVRFFADLYRGLSPGLLAGLLSACFLLGGAAVTVVLLDRRAGVRPPALWAAIALGAAALASGTTLAVKLEMEGARVEAIVLSENAYLRSGPSDGSSRLAEIHEGLKVRVIGSREGWLQVELANGLTGWLPDGQAARI